MSDDQELSDLERAVRDQLDAWKLTSSPEGAALLDIAHRLTDDDLRPAAAAMLHAQLRSQLVDLRKLAPPAEADDGVAKLQDAYEGLRAV